MRTMFISLALAACADRAPVPASSTTPPAVAPTAPTAAPATACALDATYRFGRSGGMMAFRDTTTLAPPGAWRRGREAEGDSVQPASCSPSLPPCGAAGAIDVADVAHDLADPDVQRAFEAQQPVYGIDDRPVDGVLEALQRGDGKRIFVGHPCAGRAGCVDAPAGVARLFATLRALDAQQLKDPACAVLAGR